MKIHYFWRWLSDLKSFWIRVYKNAFWSKLVRNWDLVVRIKFAEVQRKTEMVLEEGIGGPNCHGEAWKVLLNGLNCEVGHVLIGDGGSNPDVVRINLKSGTACIKTSIVRYSACKNGIYNIPSLPIEFKAEIRSEVFRIDLKYQSTFFANATEIQWITNRFGPVKVVYHIW